MRWRRIIVRCVPTALVVVGVGAAAREASTGWPWERSGRDEIREPAVAGQFYPEDPVKLGSALDGFLKDARPAGKERPVALVVPHAGYIFSGQIAADAFAQAAPYPYEVVVILGTNHTVPGFSGLSIWGGGGFRTPLGVARVDRELARKLAAADTDFQHDAAAHRREHSIEVQVPFVQRLFPQAAILPVVVGSPDAGLGARFGAALARLLGPRQALVVASSDLSHYPSHDDAVAIDRSTLLAIAALDPDALRAALHEDHGSEVPGLDTRACGEAPILVAMAAAAALGAGHGTIVSYANSGDCAVGEPDRVVGYGAVVLAAGPPPRGAAAQPAVAGDEMHAGISADDVAIAPADRQALLTFARESIHRFLVSETVPLARGFAPALCCKRGAFVTLEEEGELRGCIGHMHADTPLAQVVGAMALQAAFNDRRFTPVGRAELDRLDIEISVLGAPRPIPDAQAIVVGRDGVVLEMSDASAVFLPQVAVDQGWDVETMLEQLCRKAGLAGDCWREGARFRTFTAEVFGESHER